MKLNCLCYDGACEACVEVEEQRERDVITKAKAEAFEEAAMTIEAYAETKIPTFWTALREAARRVRALRTDSVTTSEKK